MPESNQKSKPKRAAWPIMAVVAGAALLAFVAGRATSPAPPTSETSAEHTDEHSDQHEDEHEGHGEEIVFEGDALQTADVQVAPVALAVQTNGIPFTGQIEASPDRVVRVSSVVPGRVTQVLVSIGERVQRGQVLAIVESRAVGEAQSAYQQAQARFDNAQSNLNVVNKQARAGVFSRAPLETAQRERDEAQAQVLAGESAVRQARTVLENVQRQARIGTFASPALEAARAQSATATGSVKTAEAALSQARAAVSAAQKEIARRQQLAQSGAYVARPLEEARRTLSGARAARAAAQSEVATTRANLNRAKSLAQEGLVSQRDGEAAQQAFDSATAQLETSRADFVAAQQEAERQQKLAASDVVDSAEIGAAQSALATAQAAVQTRTAEVERARESVKLASVALSRERVAFGQNIANRREISTAQSTLENAQNALNKARQSAKINVATYERERRIFAQKLNDTAQIQSAQSTFNAARAELKAARTALSLLKSAPGDKANVPIVAPIAGVVQEREVTRGEVITGEEHLMTIADLSVVHVDMFLPERDIARISLGAPVTIQIEAVPGRTFSGRIGLIHSRLDPKTRTVEAHAEIPNNGSLRVGMAARGQIATSSQGAAITIPADAVQTREGQNVVFVQSDEPNAFVAREVETGATQGGRTVIKNGLKAGERVVIKGAFIVKAQAMKAELGHSH